MRKDFDEQVVILECPRRLNAGNIREVSDLLSAWREQSHGLFVLDFYQTEAIEDVLYRPLALFAHHLKRAASDKSAKLSSIYLSPTLEAQIRAAGLFSVFNPKRNLLDAKRDAGISHEQTPLSVDFINPFLLALQETLRIQLGVQGQVGKPFVRKSTSALGAEAASVMRILEDHFDGTVSVLFEARTLEAIQTRILGGPSDSDAREASTSSSLTQSVAAEVINAMFGIAKRQLNETGRFKIRQAIPQVQVGAPLRDGYLQTVPAFCIPIVLATIGNLWLEIACDQLQEIASGR